VFGLFRDALLIHHRHYATSSIPDSIFVTNVSGLKGNSPILIGLLEYFQRHIPSVGFFMPVGSEPLTNVDPPVPKHVALLRKHFSLVDPARSMYGVPQSEASSLLASGRTDELLDRVWSAYSEYRRGKELVIVEGSYVEGVANQVELNGRFASELGAPVLMVLDFHRDEHATVGDMVNRALIARGELSAEHADVLGVVLNKVPPTEHALITSQLGRKLAALNIPFAGGIPADTVIGSARLNEVAVGLGVRLLYGDPDDLDADVSQVMVCAQDVRSFLKKMHYLDKKRRQSSQTPLRPLVLTIKDRCDVVLSLAAAHHSGEGPTVAGLLLCDAHMNEPTEGSDPADRILRHFSDHLFPVMEVDMGLYETARQVSSINPGILPDSSSKIRHAKELFARHIDANVVASQLALPKKKGKLTPKSFIHHVQEICRADRQHIVLPESTDKRVLTAACELVSRGLARITLLGSPAEVHAAAKKYNVNIDKCEILDFLNNRSILQKYADALVEARKSKGMTMEHALDALADMNMFGTMMVRQGDADAMVSGATCTTAATIRPAMQVLKTPQRTLISSVFFMCLPDKVLVYGDCAVNVDPSAEELAEIAITSAGTASAFGLDARVAMLSYSTLGSGSGPAVEKVQRATQLVKERMPELLIEGPIQYDAAVDPAVAAQKVKGESDVAGKATVCIFPDLNTGNNTYKAVQQSTGAVAIGPLMQGLAKPVNDLSRGCTVNDIINTVACTAVQAIGSKRKATTSLTEPSSAAAAA
jgi:phosphate acetyltransferase